MKSSRGGVWYRGTWLARGDYWGLCAGVTVVNEAVRAVDPRALPTNDEDDRTQLYR